MAADFRVVWFSDFESAVVRANSQHVARWFGWYLGRCGLEVWKLNLSGDAADKLVGAAEASALTVEVVDLESLRLRLKKEKPPDRGENKTQRMIVREVK